MILQKLFPGSDRCCTEVVSWISYRLCLLSSAKVISEASVLMLLCDVFSCLKSNGIYFITDTTTTSMRESLFCTNTTHKPLR